MFDQQNPQPTQIRIPFDMEPVGLGDVIKRITDWFGIPQCGGCQQRQQQLNERAQIRSLWED